MRAERRGGGEREREYSFEVDQDIQVKQIIWVGGTAAYSLYVRTVIEVCVICFKLFQCGTLLASLTDFLGKPMILNAATLFLF